LHFQCFSKIMGLPLLWLPLVSYLFIPDQSKCFEVIHRVIDTIIGYYCCGGKLYSFTKLG
jgi:hypothetical protein